MMTNKPKKTHHRKLKRSTTWNRALKKGQSRDTGNIRHKTERLHKQQQHTHKKRNTEN